MFFIWCVLTSEGVCLALRLGSDETFVCRCVLTLKKLLVKVLNRPLGLVEVVEVMKELVELLLDFIIH